MSSTLPAPVTLPAFDAARQHAETARSGVRLTIAACVALGLELIRLKEFLGYSVGRPTGKCFDNQNIKWPDLVERETGFSYNRCQDFIKAANAVRERILATRKKEFTEIRLIVSAPPSEWTQDDYLALADHIGTAFTADTFKALMVDLGFGPQPLNPSTPQSPAHVQLDLDFVTMSNAHDRIATPILGLHRTQLNPADFVRALYDLPVEDRPANPDLDQPSITGLKTLSHILATALQEIGEAIKAKGKGARRAAVSE